MTPDAHKASRDLGHLIEPVLVRLLAATVSERTERVGELVRLVWVDASHDIAGGMQQLQNTARLPPHIGIDPEQIGAFGEQEIPDNEIAHVVNMAMTVYFVGHEPDAMP